MRFGVTIDGEHSWDDLRLVLTDAEIGQPEVQTSYVDVPGMDGQLDLSEALTGRPMYKNRTINLTFATTPQLRMDRWSSTYSDVAALCHGRKVQITFDGDEEYYYVGRGSITGHTIDGPKQTITVSFNCEPYKYKNNETVKSIALTTTATTVMIYNDHMPAIPEITVDSSCYIYWGDSTYSVSAGTWTSLDIEFEDGANEMIVRTVSGTGTLTFVWQEGRL